MQAVDLIFSFDTTGSMYPVLQSVRDRIESAFLPLFADIPDLRIGMAANGDYGDRPYTTQWSALSSDLYPSAQFTRNAKRTAGFGNGGEAYEQILAEAKHQNWRADARKVLVLIGDELAHGPNWHENRNRTDWRREASDLYSMGVTIYTIQALSRREATPFYAELAEIGNGYHLTLDQFSDIVEIVKAIAYYQKSAEELDRYEQQVVSENKMSRSLDKVFGTLKQPRDAKGRFVSTRFKPRDDGLIAVEPGRFQIFRVEADQDIRTYAQNKSLIFKTGKGFYEFTKTEEIQEKKEVVLRDRVTGDLFSGPQAREMIGLPFGQRGNIKPKDFGKYQVFIQSTSYNRKLKSDTSFLYEVDLDN